ncbi:DNA polymerase epsilon catalytic subunit A [Acorus calamus]|uniref:DNA polymerase epsilon catalytic subunit n=1 Tax=Acorus calamus TaxID=4465 RepID=A0AAV9FC49_ACOCL|nr:DNA polymerase epsilon catalytic subunit A [Acorus calamus]
MNGDNKHRREDRSGPWNPVKQQKLIRTAGEELESKLGFDLFTEGDKRLGWLLTFAPSSLEEQESNKTYSCVDLYFVTQDGSTFKSKYKFSPYFYAATKSKMELDVEAYLRRKYEGQIADIEIVDKEDLALKNHLSGLHKSYLKIRFDTVQQLTRVRNDLLQVVERNQDKIHAAEAYEYIFNGKSDQRAQDYIECIIDLREFDVPYHVRFAIDNDVRCGQWYDVRVCPTGVTLERRPDLLQRADVHVCAFDIETTKLPLKFPDAEYDLIMMISYMVDGQGYLIINRECVGEDIEDLEYTPKPEFEGYFKVTNAKNEEELIILWFAHMRDVKPGIYVTYNGDFFDWPFLEKRASHHGLKMSEAVTKAKLGYDPLEVNPEDMVRFAIERPQTMASYSVSDAVATYYLYMTYVHPFIFSLATIIPMPPDEVLRKGSGTLCEMLLMVQAYMANVICPNKHQEDSAKFYNNRLLESETYIGGHVECLESGVFRSDLPTKFQLDPSAYEQLIRNLDRDLQYTIKVEGKMDVDSVSNYDEIKNAIMEKLVMLRDNPAREECPLIYHLDVAAMYPNIILTNRLQAYKRVLDKPITELREAEICMRENPFYVDTVRSMAFAAVSTFSFRDRRYEYKGLNKLWKGKLTDAKASGNSMKIQEAQDMVVLYDSLQLAHKCILNSFYGYVMRNAFEEIKKQSMIVTAYPCFTNVARNNTNDQYQTLKDPVTKTYTTHSECSIEFEVDGPYKAMILPASKEEGILIKKRYAVFNDDGTLAELKGFEIKRRGELKLIKVFQAEVFDKFLHGATLEECYSAVASVANRWLDLLDNQGIDIADSELLDYISESSTMSKSLIDYGEQKSCAVTTARRLADFLGDTMVKDKGLRCQYIIACEPQNTPVSERAIPVAIFETDAEIGKFYVRKWCKISSDIGIRSIIDWSYYKQRLSSAIQKIITIPAAMQKVSNPVPRVVHPEWLHKKVREKEDKFRQRKINDVFSSLNKEDAMQDRIPVVDLEDIPNKENASSLRPRPVVHSYETNKGSHLSKTTFPVDPMLCDQEQTITDTNRTFKTLQNRIDTSTESIDRNVDYQGWLEAKKRKWKDNREERKKRRLGEMKRSGESHYAAESHGSVPSHKFNQVNRGVNSFFRRPDLVLVNSHWQVIIDEDQFRAESRKLAAHLADPEVEGIYETKVPLEYGAILQIGCVCKVDRGAKSRNVQDGWTLSELQMKTTAECSYLAQAISFFYLYHSFSEGRGIHVIYFPVSSTVNVLVVNPFQNKELSPSILEKQFREACESLSSEFSFQANKISFKVPLGNFEFDWLLLTADIFFSRALRDQQQVLWISDDGIPDLGGIAEEDSCFADEVQQPVLTYPGAYRRVTVELKVHHLAVNALLKSNLVDEMEGGALLGFDHDMYTGSAVNEQTGFDETDSCAPAFRVLKQLIQRCISDAVTSGNVYADAILQHLYRWICSPMSKLHDPALHRILHKVMQKVFALLLVEIRKLGGTIIFANFSKIIIDTGKFDLVAAQAYCDCLLKTLQTRDLFEWIELESLQFWHSLLFMDQYNYGGIQVKANAENTIKVHRPSNGNMGDESQVEIVSSWNIADYLPKEIQISSYFSAKLLEIVCDTLHHFKGKSKNAINDPLSHGLQRPDASHANTGDAALNFIKHVCAVLALDQSVQHDILRLRKNLLKRVGVKEFAPEAQFCDPFISFTLPNVICSYCNDCRDLDLGRDSALLDSEWRCAVPHCGQPYNREQMENSLLQIVRQRERLNHLQDLVCLRCKQGF